MMRKKFLGASLIVLALLLAGEASAQIISGQGAAANSANVTQWNGTTVATGNGTTSAGTLRVTLSSDSTGQVALASGSATVGKIDILGNAGGILDFAGQNATQPANSLLVGCAFNTSPTAVTSGNATQVQCDSAGNALVKVNTSLPTGSNVLGKVGIDQTTAVTTNGVVIAPVAGSAAGITPVVSAAAEGSHVFKASAGNAYSIYVTTGATAGYLMVFNATAAPADGAVTPIDCIQAPANTTVSLSYSSGPPDVFSTGITGVFSSTGCFTKTISATAFFKGRVV
jgi:hypothetical protein